MLMPNMSTTIQWWRKQDNIRGTYPIGPGLTIPKCKALPETRASKAASKRKFFTAHNHLPRETASLTRRAQPEILNLKLGTLSCPPLLN
jgi:hypothetical protein